MLILDKLLLCGLHVLYICLFNTKSITKVLTKFSEWNKLPYEMSWFSNDRVLCLMKLLWQLPLTVKY